MKIADILLYNDELKLVVSKLSKHKFFLFEPYARSRGGLGYNVYMKKSEHKQNF